MKINNARKWVQFSLPHRFFMTLLITGVVFAVRYSLHSYLGNKIAFLPFLLTAQIIAFFYGYTFGFFTLVLGAVLGAYYFIPPYETFSLPTGEDLVILSGYFIASSISIVMIEHLRRSRYSNRLLLMMSQSRYNCLLRLDNHRLHLQRRATRARQDLSDLLEHFGQVILLILPNGDLCLQNKFYELTGTSPSVDIHDWQSYIDEADKQRIATLLLPEQAGRFLKHRVPMHFTDTRGNRKPADCILQTFPLDSGKTAVALRFERRKKNAPVNMDRRIDSGN
jgi:K+-sensing histidine kinase KdpD